MAKKPYKVKTFSVSTETDLTTLENFISNVKFLETVVQVDGKVLVIYEE